jgi:D-tyrosyl-tRNA(Tyr) deacylase
MRAILQRVESAAVRVVGGEVVAAIGRGVLALVGAERGDGPGEAVVLARKLAEIRLFEDPQGRMNLDAAAVGGAFLVVSQFTLAASLVKGRRPSLNGAAAPAEAEPLVERVIAELAARGFEVAGGRFGARMKVELVNDGPVTFVVDVRAGRVV